jgi:hypothetical protein
MIGENERRLQEAIARDFKTASSEYVFETAAELLEVEYQKGQLRSWMEPVEAAVPRFLRPSGHKAVVYRDPYGVALIMGPFNGPLTLMVRPALAALAGGNTCVLKLHPGLAATSPLLLELVPRYFDPEAVTAVLSDIEETTELLNLPFDFNREPPTAKPDATKPGRERPARLEYWALEGRMGDDVIIDDPSDAHRDRGAGGRRFPRLRSFTHTTAATKFHGERDILGRTP